VTVVVPCFNYAHFLPETLESVLLQSHPSWECIVVNDGSTDDTEAVVQSFARRDGRYRYIYQSNQGLSAARNRGMQEGRGEYFQFLDADDLIESHKLECHVRHLEKHGEVGIVYSPVRYFTGEPRRERRYSMREPDEPWMPQTSGRGLPVVSAMARTNFMAVNCPLVRRQVIARAGQFDETLPAFEDWDYWIRCAIDGTWFQYLDEPDTYALVRHHPASMSQDALRTTRAMIPLCRRALQLVPEADARDLFASRLAAARHALYVLQLRQDMPLRGLFNGFVLGLAERRYRIFLQCLLGLLLLPFIGKRRVAGLLLDVSWSRVVRSYFSR
jgi:glycosyltransferase involved in cell wall biosynthesis